MARLTFMLPFLPFLTDSVTSVTSLPCNSPFLSQGSVRPDRQAHPTGLFHRGWPTFWPQTHCDDGDSLAPHPVSGRRDSSWIHQYKWEESSNYPARKSGIPLPVPKSSGIRIRLGSICISFRRGLISVLLTSPEIHITAGPYST